MKAAQPLSLSPLLPQPAVAAVTGVLAVCALAVSWLLMPTALSQAPLAAVGMTMSLVGAVIVAYQYPIHVRHQTKVYLFTIAYYLMAVLVPPPLAALGAGIGALAGELSRRESSGAYVSDIVTEVARRVLIVLPGALIVATGSSIMPQVWTVILAIPVLLLLDVLSLPLVLSPMSGERPFHALQSAARETIPAESVQYAAGLVGALAALQYPWVIAVLVVPSALLYRAFKMMREMSDGTRLLLENMADAVDLRDPYTGGHSQRVTAYCAAILRSLGQQGPEVDLILTASRVHDIGKIGLPDAILNKPGPLTTEERAQMQQHPVQGALLIARYRDFARGTAIVRHHHERWDGQGYPDGLKGATIPFGARVIAIADSYDAMTSDRPYRRGMSRQQAITILLEGRGTQWDAGLVDAFVKVIATLPDPVSIEQSHFQLSSAS